jgi:GT2 family glycosyltransferase
MTRAATVEVSASVPFSDGLDLVPVSRRPIVLNEATVREVMSAPVPVMREGDDSATPRVSVIVVTYNNLVFTRMCLGTLLGNTDWPNFEVIVIDNASTDGTAEYLRDVARRNAGVRVVINEHNRGFAAANNQGLAMATGDVLVLLNNDTMVPPGWLGRLVGHLEDASIGCVGAVTNRIGNEAEIEADYRTYGEMLRFAVRQVEAHRGERFEIRTPCMFCLAMRRDAYERVGPIDERYEVGMLEDDDYAMRMREAGYGVVCAEDVFVHHFGQASFGALFASGKYGELIEANRRRFEEKWGLAWRPYERRDKAGYEEMAGRIGRAAESVVPAGCVVAVVSKGDEGLLELGEGRVGWHFPRRADGAYSGCYPADGAEAVAHLEAWRSAGAEFWLLPATAMWWLERYAPLREHLRGRYRVALEEPGVCTIFDLRTLGPSE